MIIRTCERGVVLSVCDGVTSESSKGMRFCHAIFNIPSLVCLLARLAAVFLQRCQLPILPQHRSFISFISVFLCESFSLVHYSSSPSSPAQLPASCLAKQQERLGPRPFTCLGESHLSPGSSLQISSRAIAIFQGVNQQIEKNSC